MQNPIIPLLAFGLLTLAPLVSGEEARDDTPIPGAEDMGISTYPARFFEQYQPLTALDMARLVPGFQIDDGEDLRGFGAAAGNILIND